MFVCIYLKIESAKHKPHLITKRCANCLLESTQIKEREEYSTVIKNKLNTAKETSPFQDHLQGTKGRK